MKPDAKVDGNIPGGRDADKGRIASGSVKKRDCVRKHALRYERTVIAVYINNADIRFIFKDVRT